VSFLSQTASFGGGVESSNSVHLQTRERNMAQMAAHDFEGTHGGDISPIDEMDPSLSDGFHVIYDREVSYNSN
jgi:hypothetical protein